MGNISDKIFLTKDEIISKYLKKKLSKKDIQKHTAELRRKSTTNPGPYKQDIYKKNKNKEVKNVLSLSFGRKKSKSRKSRKSRKL